jgi:branched-chain amino acid transport system substrate-binding protein
MMTSSSNTFDNPHSRLLVGDVKFGAQGEWAESRVLQVQFQHIHGADLGQFKDLSTQVVLTPPNTRRVT